MLKWFDLNHLVKMKFHMLDVCPSRQTSQITTDWLGLAIRFTDQTEHFEHSGCLPYLPDTSAIHLSTFGIMCHRVGTGASTSTADGRADRHNRYFGGSTNRQRTSSSDWCGG